MQHFQEYEKEEKQDKDSEGCADIESNNVDVFTILELCPNIGQTKVCCLFSKSTSITGVDYGLCFFFFFLFNYELPMQMI